MQVSALSTIIAAQQARSMTPARPAANTPAARPAAAAAAPAPSEDFAPLAFATQPGAASAQGDAPPRPAYPANAALGSQVDIRV